MPEALARAGYNTLLVLLTPLFLLHLALRARRQPEYLRQVKQRFGRYGEVAAPAHCIWIHAVSVGETRAAEPLMLALARRYPKARFLLTHTTPTGRAVALAASLDVTRVYLPYDYGFATRAFCRHFTPAVGILMETEVWPNLTRSAGELGIPMALANARLSQKSLRRGQRFTLLLGPALARLQWVLAQSHADAERLTLLGAVGVKVVGNLKFDAEVPPEQLLLGAHFRSLWQDRLVFLAASTREGEEALIVSAWRQAALPERALLVLVPRHPQRFDDIATLLDDTGVIWQKRSEERNVDDQCQIVLGDSMGEMLAYYASADVAYVGGGLLPFGTHNLIEACAVGRAVLLGPHHFNFAEATRDAVAAGAALVVDDASQLVREALTLLVDVRQRQAMGAAALNFALAHRGATEQSVNAMAPVLDLVLQ